MSESKLWRLQRAEAPKASTFNESVRWIIRAFLMAAILAMAIFKGYSQRGLVLLGVALIWALLLPVVFKAGAVVLTKAGIEGRARRMWLGVIAVLLLGAFAIGARLLITGG